MLIPPGVTYSTITDNDSRIGAGDTNALNIPLRVYWFAVISSWEIRDIFASSCFRKAVTHMKSALQRLAVSSNGAIFDRESTCVAPVKVRVLKLMRLQNRGWLSAISRHLWQTWETRSHARLSGFPPVVGRSCLSGKNRNENMGSRTSGGRREMGTSAFRRSFKVRADSSSFLSFLSMTCRRFTGESCIVESICAVEKVMAAFSLTYWDAAKRSHDLSDLSEKLAFWWARMIIWRRPSIVSHCMIEWHTTLIARE